MKKIKGLVLSVLALGCVAIAGCAPKGNDKYTVTLMYNGEVISTMEKDKATHLDAPAAPTKEGYTFVGWYVDEALTVPYTPDLLSANLTLYAKFEANTYYITFNLNGGELEGDNKVAVKNGEVYTLPVPTREGYTFLGWTLDGEDFASSGTYTKTNSIRVSANWVLGDVAGSYLITINYNGGAYQGETVQTIAVKEGEAYTLPTPTRNGYRFEGYTITVNGTSTPFAQQGTFNYEDNIIVKAQWAQVKEDSDEVPGALFLNKGDYFKERESDAEGVRFTYVFVTGGEYSFEALADLTITDAEAGVLTQNGKSFVANKADDSFTLHITKVVDGTTVYYTRNAKIVDQVTTFDGGASYSTAWGAGVANRAANFMETKADAAMAVGASNFIPEIAVGTLNSQALTQAQAHVQVTAKVDGVDTTAFTYANGVLTFDSTLVGKTVQLTFAPKYSLTNTKLVMNVKVNNGTNVYTNDELNVAYEDKTVHEINILRNIKAELAAGDYSSEGGPLNNYTNSVYARNVLIGDSIVVNGNFFKIDGSDLPLVDNRNDGSTKSPLINDAMYASNSQIGMFLYYCQIVDEAGNVAPRHEGTAVFNDLFISANYTKAADYNEVIGGQTTYTQSGSYNGIVIRGGVVTANNVSMINTNTAIFAGNIHEYVSAGQHPVQLTMNSVKFVHSWSSHFYFYNYTTLDIKTSYFGDTSGPMIVVDDIATNSAINYNDISTTITVDKATKFDSWATGEEVYYTLRGMGSLPVQMKTMVDNGVKQATGGYATAVKNIGGAQCMNIILLVKSAGKSTTGKWAEDTQGKPYVADNFAQIGVAGMPTGTPGEDQLFVAFSNAVMNPNAKNYLCGYMEVLKA